MEPDTTISPKCLLGKKKRKQLFTFLACANADGSECATPRFIGPSRHPYSFSGKKIAEFGFCYRQNTVVDDSSGAFQMASGFRFLCVTNFSRLVKLLLNKYKAHGQSIILLTLLLVHVLLLSKNTTTRL